MENFKEILSKGDEFSNYLRSFFETNTSICFLDNLIDRSDVYVFGGLIKNFFINRYQQPRDIDIVVSELSDELVVDLSPYVIRRNQFGGLKLRVEHVDVDLWEIGQTWSLDNKSMDDDLIVNRLLKTVFFNSTAILFSLRENKFIFDSSFEEFIQNRKLGIVNEENPFPELCIVKTCEYIKKYNFSVSLSLLNYLNKYFEIKKDKIEKIQIKHYGNVVFSTKDVERIIVYLNEKEGLHYNVKV